MKKIKYMNNLYKQLLFIEINTKYILQWKKKKLNMTCFIKVQL